MSYINKPSDSTMISLKHLEHLFPKPTEMTLPQGLGKTPWITRLQGMKPEPRWDPTTQSYLLNDDYLSYWSVGNYVASRMAPTLLWSSMFGKPGHDVWNRFIRTFHNWTPQYLKLRNRYTKIASYWDMDWLTNVRNPRINQFDPVNYVEYCEKHLNYDAVRKPEWMDISNLYSVIDPVWWTTSIRDPFKDNLYPIDDVCKWHLAQMFPVKPITKKRII